MEVARARVRGLGKGRSRSRRGRPWEAGVRGQRSLLPGRAQRETRVAADVSPPEGNGPLALCVLCQGPEKDRAEGGVSAGWMGRVCVTDSVWESTAPRGQECAGGGRTRRKGHVGGRSGAREEGRRPVRWQCERSQRPRGRDYGKEEDLWESQSQEEGTEISAQGERRWWVNGQYQAEGAALRGAVCWGQYQAAEGAVRGKRATERRAQFQGRGQRRLSSSP